MKYLLLLGGLGTVACSSESRLGAAARCPRQEVYLYADNTSRLDTLANLTLTVDDSLVLAQPIPRTHLGADGFVKMVRLCRGMHQVHIHFGRYTQDTTFIITQKSSLLTAMSYDTIRGLHWNNGITAKTLVRNRSSEDD